MDSTNPANIGISLYIVNNDEGLEDVSEVNVNLPGERVQFGARVSGNNGEPIPYTFTCGNVTYDSNKGTIVSDISGAGFLCEYQMPGEYMAKLKVGAPSGELSDAIAVHVGKSESSFLNTNIGNLPEVSWTFPATVALTLLALAIYTMSKSIYKKTIQE